VFDGYHPAKIKNELVISDYLYACIIPKQYINDFAPFIHANIKDRTHYIPQDGLGLCDWTDKVYNYGEELK
jgi:hypothetical protein